MMTVIRTVTIMIATKSAPTTPPMMAPILLAGVGEDVVTVGVGVPVGVPVVAPVRVIVGVTVGVTVGITVGVTVGIMYVCGV